MEHNDTQCFPTQPAGSLLVIRPVAALIWVVGARHLSLGRGTLHSRWRGPPGSGPHPRTESSWLVERGAEGALVFGERLHGVGVVVVRWGGINGRSSVLWRRSWRWVVYIRGHDVPWWWRRGCGHGGRSLVVNHVWCPRALGGVLHWVTYRRRWRGWTKVLLRWRHHVVRV